MRLNPQFKSCVACHEEKSFEDFYGDKRARDGKFSSCKNCTLERQGKRRRVDRSRPYDKAYWEVYRAENKSKLSDIQKRYRENNRDKVNLRRSKARAAKKNALPVWLNERQRLEISYKYSLATELTSLMGEPYEVDHIVPLQGMDVCGLHVPWNLQVLPRDLNRKKSNVFKTSCK